jgi:hypothetical protein
MPLHVGQMVRDQGLYLLAGQHVLDEAQCGDVVPAYARSLVRDCFSGTCCPIRFHLLSLPA